MRLREAGLCAWGLVWLAIATGCGQEMGPQSADKPHVLPAETSAVTAGAPAEKEAPAARIYGFVMDDIRGKPVSLADFEGKVLLIVNVASKCGFTPQYAGLQALYEKYGDDGLVVLGFPANNFKNQEPGTNAEIKAFCRTNYGVTFPMFAKISVKGDDKAPLYAYLTEGVEDESLRGEIGWNFTKFLVDRHGRILARFDSRVTPDSEEVQNAVAAAIAAQ